MAPSGCKEWVSNIPDTEEEVQIRELIALKGLKGNHAALARSRMVDMEGNFPDRYEKAKEDLHIEGPCYMLNHASEVGPISQVGKIQPKRRGWAIAWGGKFHSGTAKHWGRPSAICAFELSTSAIPYGYLKEAGFAWKT